MNVTIQPKTDTLTSTDPVNASMARDSARQGFLSTLSDAARKLDAAHSATQTDPKASRDRRPHGQAKADVSGSTVDSATVPVPLPVTLPAAGTVLVPDPEALPSVSQADTGAAPASPLAALSTSTGLQGDSSSNVDGIVDPSVLQPKRGGAEAIALPPSTNGATQSGDDIGTQPSTNVTDEHEAALRAAIATASQTGVPQYASAAKDLNTLPVKAAQVPKATDSLPASITGAAQGSLQSATIATPVQLAATMVNGMPPAKDLKGLSSVRAASSTVAEKSTGIPASTATDSHRKTSAPNETSNADGSSTGSDDPQNKSEDKPNFVDANVVQYVVSPHTEASTAVPSPTTLSTSTTEASVRPAAPEPTALALPAHVAQPEPIAMPMVNSARLIQSIQQSDMRVGINSSQFGVISIHTSSSQGVISSEITLGHAELAKAISAHLSAMQDKPGPVQVLSVRVETNSSIGASSGGLSQESQDRREQYSGASRPSGSSSTGSQPWAEQKLPVAARIQSPLDGRLDIRV